MSIFGPRRGRPSTVPTHPPKNPPKHSTLPETSLPPQTAPLLTLPLELIHLVSSYLPPPTRASLSLTSRYTYHALGTAALSNYLSTSNLSKFERRKKIEILERAFPSHWYCAWCDTFHLTEAAGGPQRFARETRRPCAEFNGYLHDGWAYVLCYHHVRLAVNRVLWGEEYGVALEEFGFKEEAKRKIGRVVVNTRVEVEARVVGGTFLLRASLSVTVPTQAVQRPGYVGKMLLPSFPQVVVGHRDSHGPHTGMVKSVDIAVRNRGYSKVQLCSVCATDYRVTCQPRCISPSEPVATDKRSVVEVKVWRHLGNGRNPFDTRWRAHGELGNGVEGFSGDVFRLASLQSGDIKKAFESGDDAAGTARQLAVNLPVGAGEEA